MLHAGATAPDFCLPDQHGKEICLADYHGRWVLLWWYPKAETPGCTVEGQVLRDNADGFAAANCAVLGASFDTPAENLAFANVQGFEFPLLSDVDHQVGASASQSSVRRAGQRRAATRRGAAIVGAARQLAIVVLASTITYGIGALFGTAIA